MRESRTRGVDRGTKYFRTMCLKQESLAAGGYEDKVTVRFLCHISHISSARQPSAQKGLMANAVLREAEPGAGVGVGGDGRAAASSSSGPLHTQHREVR